MNNEITLHTVNEEARVLDTDLAERLGYGKFEDIRALIKRNAVELGRYGIIGTTPINTGKRGRPGNAYYLNEEQALLVCIFSETENAALVRKQVISTFMAYRRGQLPVQQTPALPTNYVEALKALVVSEEAKLEAGGWLQRSTTASIYDHTHMH